MRRVRLSRAEARRIALAAQGFDRARPKGRPDVRHFRRVIDTLGLLQLDYVNVLMPAQFLVLWSRLGAYDRERFERFIYDRGEYTEQWAHEASIVPAAAWPLLEHRRRAHEMSKHNPLRKLKGRRAYLDAVLEKVRNEGAQTANDMPPAMARTMLLTAIMIAYVAALEFVKFETVFVLGHVIVILSFLLIVLNSKHLHIFTSEPNVAFKRQPIALGALEPIRIQGKDVDFENIDELDEDAALGIGKVELAAGGFGGASPAEVAGQFDRLLAEAELDKAALKELVEGKW